MEEYNVKIDVTDKFTDDVRKCLGIFYDQTPGSEYSSLPGEWEYWFSKNPYGNGLYSIARDGEKLVGFCALIPIEMVVNKDVIRGAKAEFLFILPEYRKRTKNLKNPVSVNLLRSLYENSYNYNFNLIFGVATRAAAKAHLAAGKKPMDLELLHYFTLFKPRAFSEFKWYKRYIYKYGTFILSASLRSRINKYKNCGFTILNSFDDIEPAGDTHLANNELLFHDKKMLRFRFKSNEYVVYRIENPRKDFLVFSKPFKNGRVFLRHWSTLDLSYDEFSSVLRDVYKKCIECGAQSVNLVFSGLNNNLKIDFTKLGFLNRKSLDVLLLYKSNPSLELSYNVKDWYFTDSHRGFI